MLLLDIVLQPSNTPGGMQRSYFVFNVMLCHVMQD
jgi:hypothetical protein